MEKVRIEIGGIGLLFYSKERKVEEDDKNQTVIKDFIRPGKIDVDVRVEMGPEPKHKKGSVKFRSGKNWRLYELSSNDYMFKTYKSTDKDSCMAGDAICIMKKDFKKAKIYILPNKKYNLDNKMWFLENLMNLMGQLVIVNLLPHYDGLLIHSAGIILRGKGIIFCGISGAGKTTLATLWKKNGKVVMLSDDRVILRKEKGKYFVYGTPWPGEGRISSNQKAPLSKIIFLSKASFNRISPLERQESLRRLLTQCFPAMWDRGNINFMIDFFQGLVRNVPSYLFNFTPTESSIEFIEGQCQ